MRKMSKDQYEAYLQTLDWAIRRRKALQHAKRRCQVCNSTRRLQVHHRDYSRIGNEDPGDLTVLCDRCHELVSSAPWVPGGPRNPTTVKQLKPKPSTGQSQQLAYGLATRRPRRK